MINIEKLKKDAEEKKKFRKKCYKKILEMCLSKIEIVAKTETTKTWYEIPAFVFGYPSYKIEEASKYVMKKLEENGFKVFFLKPNIIFINWLI